MSVTNDWSGMDTFPVLSVPVAVSTMDDAIALVNHWIAHPTRSRLVTFTNVHMIVEAAKRPEFRHILNGMDLNCPDGFPVFWLTRKQHGERVEKVSGPDFMQLFCEQSVDLGHSHFLYGGGPEVAEETAKSLQSLYPGIEIAGTYTPPYRPLTYQETEEVAEMIRASGAHVVWVCLGCPKQERWISDMRERLPGKVILAVGQAFDILAGRTERSPAFLSKHGGEWMYRLVKEPRRLWKRYFVTNLMFVYLVTRDRINRKPEIEAPLVDEP